MFVFNQKNEIAATGVVVTVASTQIKVLFTFQKQVILNHHIIF